MAKYMYLFIGGNVPDELREENGKDWMNWLEKLSSTGKMVEMGAPLDAGVVIESADSAPREFSWENDSGVGGYTIVEADSSSEAHKLLEGCPQLDPRFGGTVEIRPIMDM